jgi:hypothetical protein
LWLDITERKKPKEQKEMNALLILKTTRSSNVRQNCLANTELAFQNEQRKRAGVNQCQQ